MKYMFFIIICFVTYGGWADNSKAHHSEITFFVVDKCINDVKQFIEEIDSVSGYYGTYKKIDHDGGVNTGIIGYAIIGSKYESKEELVRFVYGATSDCAPKKTTKIDISSKNGLIQLLNFFEFRREEDELNMHIFVEDGVMRISFY